MIFTKLSSVLKFFEKISPINMPILGVTPVFSNELGDNMFRVSASYVVHKVNRIPLYLSNSIYNKTLFRHFGLHLDKSIPIQSSTNIGPYKPWCPKDIVTGTLLNDSFQYYPVLKPFENRLRELYLKGLSKPKKDYSSYSFLHISRDGKIGISYLEASVNFAKILVITDNIEWVKSQGLFQGTKFEFYEYKSHIESLSLMSSCKAGAICDGSTISWWGAFLGAYEKRNPVYFLKDEPYDNDFLPEEWLKIYSTSIV